MAPVGTTVPVASVPVVAPVSAAVEEANGFKLPTSSLPSSSDESIEVGEGTPLISSHDNLDPLDFNVDELLN